MVMQGIYTEHSVQACSTLCIVEPMVSEIMQADLCKVDFDCASL